MPTTIKALKEKNLMKIEEMGMLDAFCALSDIDENDLPKIREGKSFDVMNSQAMDAAKDFRDKHDTDDTLEVIDVNADDLEHVLDKKEYVGQVILSCKKCHAKKFIDMDKLAKSEADENIYNVDDECPNCHSTGAGYEVVGQVGKMESTEIEPEAVEQEVVPEEQEPEPLPDAEVATDTDLPDFEAEEEPVEEPVEEPAAEEPEVDNTIDDDEKDGMETDTSENDEDEKVEELHADQMKQLNAIDGEYGDYDFSSLSDKGFNHEEPEPEKEEPKKKLKLRFKESLGDETFNDLLAEIVGSENIEQIKVLNDAGDILFSGAYEDLTSEILRSRVLSWSSEDSMLVLNADSDVDSYEPPYNTVEDALEDFDSFEDNITIFDESAEGDVFTGNKEQAIELYGDLPLLSIEAPAVISIVTDNNIQPYSVEESSLSPLEEDIYRIHHLSARKVNNPKCNEYWIHESLENKEDLDILFEHYIKGTVLEQQFKRITGYRDAVDEAYDLTETEARHDNEAKAQEAAKKAGRESGAYSVTYGYVRNGKFYALEKPICCRDQKEHMLAFDLVNAKYHATVVRSLYARQFNEELNINTSSATKMEIDDNSAIISSEDHKINVESDSGADVRVNDDGSVEVQLNKEELVDEPVDEPVEEPVVDEPVEEPLEGKEVEPVPAVESVKNRSELTAAIKECKNNNIKFTVKRSLKEGFRYDVIKEANQVQPIEPVEDGEVVDPSSKSNSRELARNKLEIKVMNKIRDISKCISDNIKKYYNIEADPELIVADILQDLRLISGDIKPEQLDNSPINSLTKSMYQSYTDFYELVDEIMSIVSGQDIHTTPEQKLAQAVKMLDSDMFSPLAIERGIASDRFIEQVRNGALPYISQDQLPMLEEALKKCPECGKNPCECSKEEDKEVLNEEPCDDPECKDRVDMDIEKFDEELNEYFDQKYEDTVLYNTENGYIDPQGNILLEGVVRSEDGCSKVSFNLKPEKKMNEGVEETVYKVTNNLSEEKFEFKF